jgi:hypothetical protein
LKSQVKEVSPMEELARLAVVASLGIVTGLLAAALCVVLMQREGPRQRH